MQFHLFLYFALIAITASGWTYYVIGANKIAGQKRLTRSLRFFLLLIILYLINNSFELLAPTAESTKLLAQFDYFFIATLPVAWLLFVLIYTGQNNLTRLSGIIHLSIIPAITIVLALTNDYHHLIWQSYTIQAYDSFLLLHATTYGHWFWVNALYSNSLLMVGIHFVLITFYKSQSIFRKQTLLILIGIFIPISTVALYVLRVIPGQIKDFSPIAFAVAGVTFALGIQRYQFLDLMPVARSILVENLIDGVMVLDRDDRIIDLNPAVYSILDIRGKEPVGMLVGSVLPVYNQFVSELQKGEDLHCEVTLGADFDPKTYLLRIAHLPSRIGKIITLRDITAYKLAERSLLNSQQELERRIDERTAELKALNATLEQRVASRTHDLAALYSVSSVASEELEFNVFLERSLERTVKSIASDIGLIYLAHDEFTTDEQQHLTLELWNNYSKQDLQQVLAILKSEDWVGRTLKRRETTLIPADATIHSLEKIHPEDFSAQLINPAALLLAPMRCQGGAVGVLVLARINDPLYTTDEIALLTTIANQIGMAIKKYKLQRQAEYAKVLEERQTMAANLHDTVSQTLYGLVAFGETSQKFLERGEYDQAKNLLERVVSETRLALKEFRLFIHNLKPLELQSKGLVAAIQQRLTSVEGRSDVRTNFVANELTDLSSGLEECLYRIVQEALNNIMRHSRASEVNVTLTQNKKFITLQITDNGCGFDLSGVKPGSLGLTNMRKRALDLGGSFNITSEIGSGTDLQVVMPTE